MFSKAFLLVSTYAVGSFAYDGEVRISGGGDSGRLEACFGDPPRWGTVCADSFSDADAAIACDELGYLHASWEVSSDGGDLAPIVTGLGCVGTEGGFIDCPGATWGDDVSCSQFVTLSCSEVSRVKTHTHIRGGHKVHISTK